MALVFATDGRVKAFDFRVLTDEEQFLPNYAIVPVVRTSVLEANAGLRKSLDKLSAKLSDSVMQALNAEVDVDKKSIEDGGYAIPQGQRPYLKLGPAISCSRRSQGWSWHFI